MVELVSVCVEQHVCVKHLKNIAINDFPYINKILNHFVLTQLGQLQIIFNTFFFSTSHVMHLDLTIEFSPRYPKVEIRSR